MVIKDVDIEVLYSAIRACKALGWEVTYEYDLFDKGIDYDFVQLKKGSDEMLFCWDNWMDGEIKCSEAMRLELEDRLKIKFNVGEPFHLKPELIELELGKHKRR